MSTEEWISEDCIQEEVFLLLRKDIGNDLDVYEKQSVGRCERKHLAGKIKVRSSC